MAVIFIACASTVIFCENSTFDNDPRPNIFTAESIIERGTIKLDHYGKEIIDSIGGYGVNGHYYNYFPIGTSIFSLPVVAVYSAIGLHIVDHEKDAQIAVVLLASTLTLFFLFKIAAQFLTWTNSVLLATLFWFGTSLASTDASGLWTHDFATLWACVGLHLTLIAVRQGRFQLWPWIAAIAFAAYLCRPTMALFAGFLLLFLGTYDRRSAVKSALLMGVLLALFAGWSLQEYGEPLPPYYAGSRLVGGSVWRALYGNLLSPSRGLLIFSPFLAVVWLSWRRPESLGLKRSWLLLGIVWPLAHLVAISRFPHWWAGYSFGARLMTDVQPGLFLLTLRAWPRRIATRWSAAAGLALGLSGVFAIYVNSYQGLFNPYVYRWVREPSIDRYPAYLFDWRYPQFLHDEERHEKRMREHRQAAAPLLARIDSLRRQVAAGQLEATAPLDKSLDIEAVEPAQYSKPADFFNALYRAAFSRPPSSFELDYYVGDAEARPGNPMMYYARKFVASPEFKGKSGRYPPPSEGDADFIVDSFHNLLGRSPTTTEMAGYREELILPAIEEDRARVLVYLCVFSLWSSSPSE